MTDLETVQIARVIADALGDNYDSAFDDKQGWIAARGESDCGYRDVNQPFKTDYEDAAVAVLAFIRSKAAGVCPL